MNRQTTAEVELGRWLVSADITVELYEEPALDGSPSYLTADDYTHDSLFVSWYDASGEYDELTITGEEDIVMALAVLGWYRPLSWKLDTEIEAECHEAAISEMDDLRWG